MPKKQTQTVKKLIYPIFLYSVMNLFAVEVRMKILGAHYFVQIFIFFWWEEILDQVTSWLSDTYKTGTSRFINNSKQVMEERFIFHLANSVAKTQNILDNKVITNKEVLSAPESILEYFPTVKIRENVNARSKTYSERTKFVHGRKMSCKLMIILPEVAKVEKFIEIV